MTAPAPGAARLRHVLPVAAMIAVAFMGSVIVTPLYPLYERDFGFTPLVLTLVYGVYAIGNLLSLLVFGQLSDQLGRKRVALPALGVAAAAGLSFLLANGAGWLFLGRLLIGVAVGILSSSGTAWIAERYGPGRRATATTIAAVANMIGIALGPLVGGLLAEYAPAPLRTPLIVYLVVVAAVGVALVPAVDPHARRVERLRDVRISPRIGLAPERVRDFVAPAVTAFVTFALGGLYFSLIPSILVRDLRVRDAAVAGAVVFVLGAVTASVIVLGRRMRPVTAMRAGLLMLLPAVALVVAAQGLRSLPLLVLAAAAAGVMMALGYRGSLEVVNHLASDAQRGQLVSSYLIVCFVGNSVPVIGIGLLSTVAAPLTATAVFAVVLAVLAVLALVVQRTRASG